MRPGSQRHSGLIYRAPLGVLAGGIFLVFGCSSEQSAPPATAQTTPEDTREATPEPEVVGVCPERPPRARSDGNPLFDCASENDYNGCILENLTDPRSQREYAAVIEAYRGTSQRPRACELMRELVACHPRSREARLYEQYLERQCEPVTAGSDNPEPAQTSICPEGQRENTNRGAPLADCTDAANYDRCILGTLRDPRSPDAYATLIEANRASQEHDTACDLMRQLSACHPESREAHFYGQYVQRRCASADSATTDESQDSPEHPRQRQPSMTRGNPLADCASTNDYDRCIISGIPNPRSAREYGAVINAYRTAGQRRRACVLIQELIEKYPTSREARLYEQYHRRQCG